MEILKQLKFSILNCFYYIYTNMNNQEIIQKLLDEGLIYPIYEDGNVTWIIEFPGGGEEIGSDGFSWDDICNIYRNQKK